MITKIEFRAEIERLQEQINELREEVSLSTVSTCETDLGV